MKKISVITFKILTIVVGASILLCTALFFVGFYQFDRQFDRQYRTTMISIAKTARDSLNADLFPKYLETSLPDGSWYAVHDILQRLVNDFELNLMYVSYVEPPDYSKIHYIYNPVRTGSKYKEFPLGHFEVYKQPIYNNSVKRVFEKGETIVRNTLNTRTGAHITANIPVKNHLGKVVAVLGAQKSVAEFARVRQNYFFWTMGIELFFIFIYIVLLSSYFRKTFIRPIVSITREAQRFAADSSHTSDILERVKNHDEIGTLAKSINKMENDIRDYITNLTKVTSEKERMNTELNIATSIQAGLLTTDPVQTEEVSIMASMTPAKEVGGDFYDYALLNEDHAVVIIADVSGKGVPAALFMAMGTTLLRDHVGMVQRENISFTGEVGEVNNHLCRHNEGGLFITAWIGILNTKTGRLTYIDAGHNPPLLKQDGKFAFIPKGKKGLPLASMEDFQYRKNQIYLKPGDRLILYTDGVTEAQNKEQQLYGEERFIKYAELHKDDPQQVFRDGLLKDLAAFQDGCDQFDDITMLLLDYKAIQG
jgi:sigma-B regulation protein RsbU (phosphoserine phosphatase)